MKIRDLINELNELIANGEVNEDAVVMDAEMNDVFSIIGEDNKVVIYF